MRRTEVEEAVNVAMLRGWRLDAARTEVEAALRPVRAAGGDAVTATAQALASLQALADRVIAEAKQLRTRLDERGGDGTRPADWR